jgi:HNH endonuclease
MDAKVRQFVRQRAGEHCEYCGIPESALPWATFHVEHIRARQHGGTGAPDNLALACRRCNLHKGPNVAAIDRLTGALTPLFNPRVDRWREHFAVEAHRVVGLTAVGRVTVELLKMNAPDRIQLRAELAATGGGEA